VDYGFGGAIADTESTLHVTDSSFSYNEALGGNSGTAAGTDVIGVGGAEGGAIYNEVGATATIAHSILDHNQAQGGSGNSGTSPVALVGEGLGGAISVGYGGDLFGPNTLTVTDSTLLQNMATGGDNAHRLQPRLHERRQHWPLTPFEGRDSEVGFSEKNPLDFVCRSGTVD
jgi:hypothetical protein